MIIAIWVFIAIGIGAWSLAAWLLHSLLTIDPAAVGALDGWIARVPYPDLLDRWFPQWQEWLRFALDMLRYGLAQIGDAAPVVVWVIWGIGTGVALVAGALLTWFVKLVASEFASSPRPGATAG